ncbi:MAG TPA: hypothetical protein VHC49_20270, partial [Mycobacteriales bacterium]|nr:hypothetical protein [Mycobacteriales bacterium]
MSSLRLLLGCVWTTTRWRFALLLALAAAEGTLAPMITALTGHAVTAASGPAVTADGLLSRIAVIGGLFALAMLLAPVLTALAGGIGSRVAHRLALQVFDATSDPPGLAHLEDPQVADQIRRVADFEWDLAPMSRIVTELSRALTMAVGALGAAVLLAGFSWWAPVLLLGGTLLTHAWMNDGDEGRARADYAGIERRADYYHDLALDPAAAKEIRLFGLVDLLSHRTRRHRMEFLAHIWSARRLRRGPVLATIAAIAVAHVVVLGVIAHRAVTGGL